MEIHTLVIVGVGLIGGSIAAAARQRGVARHILGLGRQAASLERAVQLGLIDEAPSDPQTAYRRADLLIVCTPVQYVAEQILEAAAEVPPECVLTDAGSTKQAIVENVEAGLPPNRRFVGSHPLAGSEKRGPEHANPRLFEDRLVIVTPTLRTNPDTIRRVCEFWQMLGARTRLMSPEEHDRAVAQTSHVPHLLAAALAAALPEELLALTATGFRDTTRIASGDPELWTGILLQNRQAVMEALARLEAILQQVRTALAEDDAAALHDLLLQAKRLRDALGN
jgi:prephenate dehydrogenase